nr:ribonuclease [Bacteroides sp.]
MRHIILAAITLITCAASLRAEAPAGYYAPLDGLSRPEELKTAVCKVINPHTTPAANNYSTYYSDLSRMFRQTDVYPDDPGRWWEMYSNMVFRTPSFSGLNREHSFPKSWWGGLTNIPPYVDLNHLYPSEAVANQRKSNYPLGEVTTSEAVYFDNGVTKVGYAVGGQGGGAKYVFEPADEYKGDFARTYFYMVTCYQDLKWATNYMYMLQQNTYPTLKPWAYEMLLEWSRNDPVSQKEIDRNEVVYSLQNNRNPFIDMPGLEEYIWGDRKGETFHINSSQQPPKGDPQLFSPVDGMALDFGQVAVGSSEVRRLLFLGEDLTGKVSVVVSRDGDTDSRRMFKVGSSSIDTKLINAAGGYYLEVTFSPTETGSHRANITVFDVTGWGAGSLNVKLIGEALDRPALSRITALPATDVTADSYVARWEVPANDVIDYYIVNRTHYVDGAMTIDRLEAEENFLLISDYDPAAYDSYTVQSVRLGFESAPSEPIVVALGGVQGVDAGQPLAVKVVDATVRFICAAPQSSARIFDITGRLHTFLPVIERNMEITLPAGVYFIVTDSHLTPVKILIR